MKKRELKNLDELWSKAVKIKANYRCEYCKMPGIQVGGSLWLNAAHVIGRRFRTTRWGCEVNGKYDLCGHSLCYTHHNQYDEHGPQEKDIRESVIGLERYDLIRDKAKNNIAKDQDYLKIKKELESIIEQGTR